MFAAHDAAPAAATVVGLLAQAEGALDGLHARLQAALAAAAPHEATRLACVAAVDAAAGEVRAAQRMMQEATRTVHRGNAQLASLTYEVGGIDRRMQELRRRMQGMADGPPFRQLRRARASLGVSLDDRRRKMAQLQEAMATARTRFAEARAALVQHTDAQARARADIARVQRLQPPAQLRLGLFAHTAVRAHARLFLQLDLGGDRAPRARPNHAPTAAERVAAESWRQGMVEAIGHVVALQDGLAIGQYSLEGASGWAGGRAQAVSQALYALVALGELARATELYMQTTAGDATFHHIFETFRGGCLGLFLVGRHAQLAEVLRLHQYAEGLRGAYVDTFLGLLRKDAAAFHHGLSRLAAREWRAGQHGAVSGLGLVNVAALGLLQLGALRGFAPPPPLGFALPAALFVLT